MKRKSIPGLGKLGTQFFAFVQMKEKEIVLLGELQAPLQLSPKQEKDFLSRMTTKGFIIRLKRGVYVVPKKIPPGGKWQPSSYYLIALLMQVINANYYIGGPSIFNDYGLTEQIPNTVTAYNDKISGTKILGNLPVQLIKVSKQKIGATTSLKLYEGIEVKIATLPRAIVDAFVDWPRYNTLPRAYKWIKDNKNDREFLRELVKITISYGNTSTKRRIGYFLDKITRDNKLTRPILAKLKPSQGRTPLIPRYKSKGITNNKWRIIDNEGQLQ